MKILFLGPHIDAEHNTARKLTSNGHGVLFAASPEEALQMLQLHGASVDLAVIHREGLEGSADSGLKLIQSIKSDPVQADLPVVLTTEKWSEKECAQHQQGSAGANAYLRHPFTFEKLADVIFGVLQQPVVVESSSSSLSDLGFAPILEDASVVFTRTEENPLATPGTNFSLEAPGLDSTDSSPLGLSIETSDLVVGTPPPVPEETGGGGIQLSAGDGGDEGSGISIELSGEQSGEQLGGFSSALPENSGNDLADTSGVEADQGTPQIEFSQDSPIEFGEAPLKLQADGPPSLPMGGGLGDDPEVAQEMPYLFGEGGRRPEIREAFDPALIFAEPTGDAVVPGGAANTPDLETFKKYLLLREQDVAVLSNQLRAAHDQAKLQEQTLREAKAKNTELSYKVQENEQKIANFEKEKVLALEGLQSEIEELKFQLKVRNDKVRLLESQVRETSDGMEQLKERVRTDIRKIRVREKELENRLEIVKEDSQALISARENKIIELKRKLDLIEFNMDLLQDQFSREKENAVELKERLARAAKMVRVAGGLLNSEKGEAKDSIQTLSPDGTIVGASGGKERKVS